jgi:hypothetical protein
MWLVNVGGAAEPDGRTSVSRAPASTAPRRRAWALAHQLYAVTVPRSGPANMSVIRQVQFSIVIETLDERGRSLKGGRP